MRTYRKRAALTQEDVAFLIGRKSGTMCSRHENFKRHPTLKTALAYAAVFGVSTEEIFRGVFYNELLNVRKRAKLLLRRKMKSKSAAVAEYKRKTLEAVVTGDRAERIFLK